MYVCLTERSEYNEFKGVINQINGIIKDKEVFFFRNFNEKTIVESLALSKNNGKVILTANCFYKTVFIDKIQSKRDIINFIGYLGFGAKPETYRFRNALKYTFNKLKLIYLLMFIIQFIPWIVVLIKAVVILVAKVLYHFNITVLENWVDCSNNIFIPTAISIIILSYISLTVITLSSLKFVDEKGALRQL